MNFQTFSDRTCASGLWLCLVWTLTLAGGSIPSYFLLFGELSLLWFFNHTVGQPQWAWHRSTSSQQLSQEEEVLCMYANLLLCVWRHSAGSIHPVLLSPLGLWGAGFLPAVKRSGNLSETTLFFCLFFLHTPSETCNRSNSFSWLACSASDSSVFFCCLQVNYAQNWQQPPATDNPEGQGSRALRSVLPFLSCGLLLWRSPEFLTARVQGNLTIFWFQ